jgi:hypothetical protein
VTEPVPPPPPPTNLPKPAWKQVGRKTQQLPPDTTAQLLQAAGFEGEEVATMVAICTAEHGRDAICATIVYKDDPTAPAHGSLDVGLCAINTYWMELDMADVDRLLTNPLESCKLAHDIYEANGFEAWNVYESPTAGAWLTHKQLGVDAAKAIGAL